MKNGKLMSMWMFPFVYVFMDTDNEMEDSFRCHQIQDFCEYILFNFFLFNYTMKENMIYEKLE